MSPLADLLVVLVSVVICQFEVFNAIESSGNDSVDFDRRWIQHRALACNQLFKMRLELREDNRQRLWQPLLIQVRSFYLSMAASPADAR